MIEIRINRGTCQGHGNCMMAAEELFDLDDEGLVVLKESAPQDAQLSRARQAAYDCPTDSISIVVSPDKTPGWAQ